MGQYLEIFFTESRSRLVPAFTPPVSRGSAGRRPLRPPELCGRHLGRSGFDLACGSERRFENTLLSIGLNRFKLV